MKNRQAAGFSLVELLVVMGIIVILSAIALPFIGQYIKNYQISGAAQKVASEIQLARTKAIMRNVNRAALFLVLPNEIAGSAPNRYQWLVPDQGFLTPCAPGPLCPFPAGGYRNVGQLQTDPIQAGTIYTLPEGTWFVANGNRGGLGFTRLGAQCDLVTNACGTPLIDDTGATMCANCVNFDAAAGQSTVTIFQTATGLQKTIRVVAGGRVLSE